MAKSKTQPESEQKSQAEIEYNRIAAFYEKIVYTTFTLIVALGILSYFDRKSILEEKNKIITDLRADIKEQKEEWREKLKDIKADSDDKLKNIKEDADSEILKVKNTTNQTVVEETQKELKTIFESDKIKNLIEKEAVLKVKDKVIEIVDSETKNFSIISDAGSLMRLGNAEGLHTLLYYSKYSANYRDRENAKQLLINISNDYFNSHKDNFKNEPIETFYELYNLPIEKRSKSYLIEFLVKNINVKDNFLDIVCDNILLLSKLTNQDFKPFEIDKINKWYEEWKKTKK